MMRCAVAWLFYGLGHAVFLVSDSSLGVVLHYALHPAYQALMAWSSDIQGDGPGPWTMVA